MTALAGLWRIAGGTDAGDRCRDMLAAQAVYGGGAPRVWDGGAVALGRDLRMTLPEDVHDRQPLTQGALTLAADIRLDDRDALADALDLGAAAATLSDADLALRAWARWGEDALGRLYGDWALAVWDGAARRLTLARDGLGGRPLHHCRTAQGVAFASMPRGLHALPDLPRAPDLDRVAEFLALFPEAGPRTVFAGMERVEPGHVVIVTEDGATTRRHWNPPRGASRPPPQAEIVDTMRMKLDQAVASRLRGARDLVAAHLSAGLDSTAAATTAARLLAPSGGRVLALTAVPHPAWSGEGPAGRLSDEGPVAALTAAAHANMDHLRVSPGSGLLDRLERDTALYDRPLLNLCNQHWWSAVAEAAAGRGARVLLTGELGNATLSWAGMEVFPELISQGRWREAWRLWRGWTASGDVGVRSAALTVAGAWAPTWLWGALRRLRAGRDPSLRHSALNPDRARAMNLSTRPRAAGLDLHYRLRRDGFAARAWHLGWVDPGVFRKAALAAWGLDIRDPTSDRRLVEYCLTLPAESFFRGGRPRALARAVLADRAPAAVLAERRRGYQAADWADRLSAARGEVRRALERAGRGPGATLLDLPRLRDLVERWPQAHELGRPETTVDYRQALLRGLAVAAFLETAKGPPGPNLDGD